MEPHGQSPWSPASRPCGATSRSHDCTFLHGQRPWSPAAGMKKIPKFKSDEEAARFWESHSFQDYYRDTKALRLIRARMKVNAKPTKQAPEIAKKPCLKTPVESFSAPRR